MKKHNHPIVPLGNGSGMCVFNFPYLHKQTGLYMSPAAFIYPFELASTSDFLATGDDALQLPNRCRSLFTWSLIWILKMAWVCCAMYAHSWTPVWAKAISRSNPCLTTKSDISRTLHPIVALTFTFLPDLALPNGDPGQHTHFLAVFPPYTQGSPLKIYRVAAASGTWPV